MEAKELLKKYYSRLRNEGLLKSLLIGLTVGFSALLVSALVWWLLGMKTIWLCALIAVAATAITTPIFYFKKYRPSIRRTAQRVDALGLEERVVTMVQFEGEDSFMVNRQREDAKATLSSISEKLLKVTISVAVIVALSVTAVCGIGMTTAAALSERSGVEIIEEWIQGGPTEYEITYDMEGDGEIIGEIVQLVEEGKNGSPVMAEPAEGWVFVQWSDGSTNPYRVELGVAADIELIAMFEMAEEEGDDAEDDESFGGGGGEDGEKDPGESQQEGQGKPQPGKENKPGDGNGAYENYNQVIDGETFYGGETYDSAYEDAVEDITNNENMTKEESDIIQDYFDTIKK